MDDAPKPDGPPSNKSPEGLADRREAVSRDPRDLAEVERALSVLQGRHPDHERVRREDAEKQAVRKASLDAASTIEARRLHRRRARIVGAVFGVLAVATVAGLAISRAVSRRGQIEAAATPYRDGDFTLVDSSTSALAITVAPGCLLVVSAHGGDVRLKHPGGEVAGPSPLVSCLCETAAIEASSADEGVVLLRADANKIGGSPAFSRLPFTPRTRGATDAACAEASFDAWLDATSWRSPLPNIKAPLPTPRGFHAVAQVTPPLGIVDLPADACVIVQGTGALRVRGGASPVHAGAGDAAWCTPAATTLTVRDGTAIVFVAPGSKIGGTAGIAELATVPRIATTDHAWNAKALLLASAVPESLLTTASTPDLGDDPDARIVATSSDLPGTMTPETGDGVWSFCAAPLCVFSGPQRWRLAGTSEGGIARAKLPFWLYGLQDANEPGAMKVAVQLLTLARRLRIDGFEPTTIEAMTETERGVEILGRANEDAVVAITLFKTAPWLVPYTDGPAWSIDGEPRVVPLATLQRTSLFAAPKSKLPPKAARHTIVFRRSSAR